MSDRSTWRDNDDALFELLEEATRSSRDVDADYVDMIMTGYDITTMNAHLAELTMDSHKDRELLAIRSNDLESRMVSYSYGGVILEFEIGPNAPHVIGHVTAERGGSVVLAQVGSAQRVELDDLGSFEFTLSSTGPFQLRYEPPEGDPVVTDWLMP